MARLLSGSGTVTGTGALTLIAPGADGQVLTSTGSVWNSEAAAGGGKLLNVGWAKFDSGVSMNAGWVFNTQHVTFDRAEGDSYFYIWVSAMFRRAAGTAVDTALMQCGHTFGVGSIGAATQAGSRPVQTVAGQQRGGTVTFEEDTSGTAGDTIFIGTAFYNEVSQTDYARWGDILVIEVSQS